MYSFIFNEKTLLFFIINLLLIFLPPFHVSDKDYIRYITPIRKKYIKNIYCRTLE